MAQEHIATAIAAVLVLLPTSTCYVLVLDNVTITSNAVHVGATFFTRKPDMIAPAVSRKIVCA